MNSGQTSAGGDAFTFDANAPMVRVTNQQILDGLRRFAAIRHHQPFRMQDFMAWKDRTFDAQTVCNRFGGWPKALALIGIRGGRVGKYDPEDLIVILEKVWRELGRRPGIQQLIKRGRCTPEPFRRHWGNLRRACELLAAHHRGELTREELLRAGPKDRPRRKGIPLDLRWRILKRDHYRCAACGQSPATHPGLDLEIDHITPVSRGGSNDQSNLRTLCTPCNRGKSDKE